MQHKYRDVQVILKAFARGEMVLTEEGRPLRENDNFDSLKMGKWRW